MWKLFSGVVNTLVGEPVKQWQRRKTLKAQHRFELEKLEHQTQAAKATALLEMAKQGQRNDFDLDMLATKNMAETLADDFLRVIYYLPIVMAFIPSTQNYVLKGFKIIDQMPAWFVAIAIGIAVVTFGMRGLLKAFLSRGNFSLSLFGKGQKGKEATKPADKKSII